MVKKFSDNNIDKVSAHEFLAYSVDDVTSITGICRQRIYDALNRRDLRAKKSGSKTLILKQDLLAFLDSLEDYTPNARRA